MILEPAQGVVSRNQDGNRESALIAFSELCWLSEIHGPVTPQMWHEQVRADTSRHNSDRQFERMKARLVKRGIPHERVEVLDERVRCLGVRMLVGRDELERYFPAPRWRGKKRCPDCGVELPATLEHFARDRGRRGGLRVLCRDCDRGRRRTHYAVKGGRLKERARRSSPARRRTIVRYERSAKARARKRRYSEKTTSTGLHAIRCQLDRALRAGELSRPAVCFDCAAEGKTFAFWPDPIRRPDELVFVCCDCAKARRDAQVASGLYEEIRRWRADRSDDPQ